MYFFCGLMLITEKLQYKKMFAYLNNCSYNCLKNIQYKKGNKIKKNWKTKKETTEKEKTKKTRQIEKV